MTAIESSHADTSQVVDFHDKLGIFYLQTVLSALQRADFALERLESEWLELAPRQRRELFGEAGAALRNAESSTSAIATWRGGIRVEFCSRLEQLLKERDAAGNTARARLEWLHRRKTAIETALLECGVLLHPIESADDIYESAVTWVLNESDPIELDSSGPKPAIEATPLQGTEESDANGFDDDDLDHILDGLEANP
jgi:hypothetical protein